MLNLYLILVYLLFQIYFNIVNLIFNFQICIKFKYLFCEIKKIWYSTFDNNPSPNTLSPSLTLSRSLPAYQVVKDAPVVAVSKFNASDHYVYALALATWISILFERIVRVSA